MSKKIKVAFQGEKGAYSHLACLEVFPDAEAIGCSTFEEAFQLARDNSEYKSQHQVDSYNEFLFSKTNGIDHIIRRENPHIIHKDLVDKTNYRYQINIYYGENLNESTGEINTKVIDNIYFCFAAISDDLILSDELFLSNFFTV